MTSTRVAAHIDRGAGKLVQPGIAGYAGDARPSSTDRS